MYGRKDTDFAVVLASIVLQMKKVARTRWLFYFKRMLFPISVYNVFTALLTCEYKSQMHISLHYRLNTLVLQKRCDKSCCSYHRQFYPAGIKRSRPYRLPYAARQQPPNFSTHMTKTLQRPSAKQVPSFTLLGRFT